MRIIRSSNARQLIHIVRSSAVAVCHVIAPPVPLRLLLIVCLTLGLTSQGVAQQAVSPPGAPTDLEALGGDESVVLSWTPPTNTSEIARYEYRRTTTGGAYPSATSPWMQIPDSADNELTEYTVTELTNNTRYYFQVYRPTI